MILYTDVANIVVDDCKAIGITDQVFQNAPIGKMTERIVVHVHGRSREKHWDKGFVEVNLCVPDFHGEPDLVRLQEMERAACLFFENIGVGKYNGSYYDYDIESRGLEKQEGYHYINIKLQFNVLT